MRSWLASLLILLPAYATHAADDAWLVSVGGDVDEDSGFRVDLGVAWVPTSRTSVSLLAGSSDTSTDLNSFSSRAASLSVDHDFQPIGVSGEVRWWGDSGLFDSTTYGGNVYYKNAGWRVSLRGETRHTEFDEFSFNTVIPIRDVQVPVSGAASCDLDNVGYGLSVSKTAQAWSFLLSGVDYDYSETDCNLTNLTLPPQVADLPRITRAIFERIAARVLNAGAQLLGSQLTREYGFLDYSVWANVGYRSGQYLWGLDFYHDREEFQGNEAETLIASVTVPVGARLDLEVRLGATDSDVEGTIGFAGLTLYAYFGGGE